MLVREYKNIKCAKIELNGAGLYYIPNVVGDQKVDSIFMYALDSSKLASAVNYYNGSLNNLADIYVTIASVDNTLIHDDTSAQSFIVSNISNTIQSTIDFSTSLIRYVGDKNLILYIYFSIGEIIVDQQKFDKKNNYVNNVSILKDDLYSYFTSSNRQSHTFLEQLVSDRYIGKKIKSIQFPLQNREFYAFVTLRGVDGCSFDKIPLDILCRDTGSGSLLNLFYFDMEIDFYQSDFDWFEPSYIYQNATLLNYLTLKY